MSAKLVKSIRIPLRRKTWKFKDTCIQEFEQRATMKCQIFLQERRTVGSLSKVDFLCCRWDGQKVAVKSTKKFGGRTKLWIMQLKWNGKLGDNGKVEAPRKSIWKPAEKKTLQQNSLLASTTIVIKIKKCVRNNERKLTLTVDEKLKAW